MNRAPQSIQKKQQIRADKKAGNNNRMHSKEGFSSHGESNVRIRVKFSSDDAMFVKVANHTVRERSNYSSNAGKPGPPGKTKLPFDGKRKFSVASPANYEFIHDISERSATFQRYPEQNLCWLYNVIFSKALRIKRTSSRFASIPFVPTMSIRQSYLNLIANGFNVLHIEFERTDLYSSESITSIRELASHQHGKESTIVNELKRYMTYSELKAFRRSNKKLVTSTSIATSNPFVPSHDNDDDSPETNPIPWSTGTDWSEFGVSVPAIFVPTSSLNGNNGSYTGTDDHDKVVECPFGCQCKNCCHYHMTRKRDSADKKPTQPASKGATRRLAEKKDLAICNAINCSDLKCHYHLPDLCVCDHSDEPLLVFGDFATACHTPPVSTLPQQAQTKQTRVTKKITGKEKLEMRRNETMSKIDSDPFAGFRHDNPYGALSVEEYSDEAEEVNLNASLSKPKLTREKKKKINTSVDMSTFDCQLNELCPPVRHFELLESPRDVPSAPPAHLVLTDDDNFITLIDDHALSAVEPSAPPAHLILPPPHEMLLPPLDLPPDEDPFMEIATRAPAHTLLLVNPAAIVMPLVMKHSPMAWMASKKFLLGALNLISTSPHTSTFPQHPLQDLQSQRSAYASRNIYLATPTDKNGYFGFVFNKFRFITTPSLGISEMTQYDTTYFHGLISIAGYAFEQTWIDVGYNKYTARLVHLDLSSWVHQFALKEALTVVELVNGSRKFRIKKHAYAQLRNEICRKHADFDAIREVNLDAYENSLVYGLQLTMPTMNLQFGGESSRIPQVDSMGKVNALPRSLTWTPGQSS